MRILYHYKIQIVFIIFFMGAIHGCVAFDPSLPPKQSESLNEKARKDAINQDYAKAEVEFQELLNIYHQYGTNIHSAYHALAYFVYFPQGRFDEAINARQMHIELRKTQLKSNDLTGEYRFIGEVFMAQGRFDEALSYFKQAIIQADMFIKANPINQDFKINSLYMSLGDLYMSLGDYDKAKKYIRIALETAVESKLALMTIAQSKNKMANVLYLAGDISSVEMLLNESISLNAGYSNFPDNVADSLILLGRIAERRGDAAKALEMYQAAVNTLLPNSIMPGLYRTERADVLSRLGRYWIAQGESIEAREAYGEALRLRRETATQTHPNYADALRGMADAAVLENNLTSATLQAEQALGILDKSVVPTHPRIAEHLVTLSALHALAGKPEKAATVSARLETILQKPLGPWKEDFLKTTGFYAGLLRKAGQGEGAGQLEQIVARQQDRP